MTAGITSRYMTPPVNHPAEPGTIFVEGAATPPSFWTRPRGACGALYRSSDAGEQWERLAGGFPLDYVGAPTRLAIDPSDPDRVYFGMSNGAIGEPMTEAGTSSRSPPGSAGSWT